MSTITSLTDGIIVCRNSQMATVRGTVLRLDRYSVAFEVYSPFSIVQLSEVLTEFEIHMGTQLLFRGRATVSSLVNAGVALVCEANLDDAWVDVDFFRSRRGGTPLNEEFKNFISSWKRFHAVNDDFKIVVSDLTTMFTGIQRWVDQLELGMRGITTSSRDDLEAEIFDQLEQVVPDETFDVLESFEGAVKNVSESEGAAHKTYVRRQLHPVILCAPFVYRVFTKPLGYAGDYEMVNMMLREPYEGGSLFAKMLNYMFLETPPVIAHRNRIDYLIDTIEIETERVIGEGRRLNALNFGCGPAGELQRFIKDSELSDHTTFTLVDFNEETLDYTESILSDLIVRSDRNCEVKSCHRSVNQVLRSVSRGKDEFPRSSYDFIYCAGLFDYLSDRVCARLLSMFYELLAPGGLLVATNVSTSNPSRGWMEFVVEWNLVYRDKKGFLDLAPPLHEGEAPRVKQDATGVNIFLEVRKPTT